MGPKRQKTTHEIQVLRGIHEDSSSTQQHAAHTPAPHTLTHSSVTMEYPENNTPQPTLEQTKHSHTTRSLRERLQPTALTEQPHTTFILIQTPQTTAEQREQPPTASNTTHRPQSTVEQTEQPPLSFPVTQTSIATQYLEIERRLCGKLESLPYGEMVKYVYNPVDYAWEIHRDFVVKFCRGRKKVLLLGMNPGPWGMGQTGVSGDGCVCVCILVIVKDFFLFFSLLYFLHIYTHPYTHKYTQMIHKYTKFSSLVN